MKRPQNKNSNHPCNSAFAVTATLIQPFLVKSVAEKLADRRYDTGYCREKMQAGWKALETSSIEAHAGIDLNLSGETEQINMPFVTMYYFTCIKTNGQDYQLTWVSSLS